MLDKPDFENWPSLMDVVKNACDNGEHEMLLTLIMTPDERETLVSRANILCGLLKGDLSQRQISQQLGVGIATITRGSAELKNCTDLEREILTKLLLQH
jgi:TrpR family transcriptional regulator, trp operon repressor